MNYTKEQLLEAADIVDKAHDAILDKGWWPGPPYRDGGLCMEAAVVHAMTGAEVRPSTVIDAFEFDIPRWLVTLLRESGIDYDWNDTKARSEDKVFDRMRQVAKRFRDEAGAL